MENKVEFTRCVNLSHTIWKGKTLWKKQMSFNVGVPIPTGSLLPIHFFFVQSPHTKSVYLCIYSKHHLLPVVSVFYYSLKYKASFFKNIYYMFWPNWTSWKLPVFIEYEHAFLGAISTTSHSFIGDTFFLKKYFLIIDSIIDRQVSISQ